MAGRLAPVYTGSFIGGRFVAPAKEITVGDGDTLNPEGSYYRLRAAGAVGLTLGVGYAEDGQFVTLFVADNQIVTIADTNILTSDGGAFAMGQYDVLTVVYDSVAAKWVEVSRSANS